MVEYQAYRDEVARKLDLTDLAEPLYFRLHVAVPEERDLLDLYDVENYLTHLVLRLGPNRIVLARATKAFGSESWAELRCAEEDATLGTGRRMTPFVAGSTTGYKAALRQHLLDCGVSELPPGAVGMRFGIRYSPRRTWANLWKATGDAFEPVLGRTARAGANLFDPQDDRIVDLSFHATRDGGSGFGFAIVGDWWSEAP
jgi:hypothetical protein